MIKALAPILVCAGTIVSNLSPVLAQNSEPSVYLNVYTVNGRQQQDLVLSGRGIGNSVAVTYRNPNPRNPRLSTQTSSSRISVDNCSRVRFSSAWMIFGGAGLTFSRNFTINPNSELIIKERNAAATINTSQTVKGSAIQTVQGNVRQLYGCPSR